MLAILLQRSLCIRKSQSNEMLPSSKSISDITVKPQALFICCTYRNFTVFCSKYNFKSSKWSQYCYGVSGAFENPNQMEVCQVLKALVILLWNHKHCSNTVPIITLWFSAQNTILKAQNARNTITQMLVHSTIPIKCEVVKIEKH